MPRSANAHSLIWRRISRPTPDAAGRRRDGVADLHLALVLVDDRERVRDRRNVPCSSTAANPARVPVGETRPRSGRGTVCEIVLAGHREAGERLHVRIVLERVDRVPEVRRQRDQTGRSWAVTVRVSDFPQGQSVGRCDLAGHLPRAGGEDLRDGIAGELAHADVDRACR